MHLFTSCFTLFLLLCFASFLNAQDIYYYGADTTRDHYYPTDIIETQNGEFVLVADANSRGSFFHNAYYGRYLVRLNANGDTVWTQFHTQTKGGAHLLEKANGSLLAFSNINGSYVCGMSGQTYPYRDYNLKTYANTGQLLIDSVYSEGCDDLLVGMTKSATGTILATHTTETANYIKEVDQTGQLTSIRLPSGIGNGLVEKNATGYWLWRYDSLYHISPVGSIQQRAPLDNAPYTNKLIKVNQDSLLVAASNNNVSAPDLSYLSKYDEWGMLDWRDTFVMEAKDVLLHSSGNYLLTGTRNDQLYMLLVSPDGDSLWSRQHHLPLPSIAVKTIESSTGQIVTLAQDRSMFTSELGQVIVIFDNIPLFNKVQKLEDNNSLAVQYFPNPSRGQVTFVLPERAAKYQLEVYTPLGQLVLSQSTTQQQVVVNTAALAQGIYWVRVREEQGGVFSGTLVVE